MGKTPVRFALSGVQTAVLFLGLAAVPMSGRASDAPPLAGGQNAIATTLPPPGLNRQQNTVDTPQTQSKSEHSTPPVDTCSVTADQIIGIDNLDKDAKDEIEILLKRLAGTEKAVKGSARCARYLTGQLRSAGYFLSDVSWSKDNEDKYTFIGGRIHEIVLSQSAKTNTSKTAPDPGNEPIYRKSADDGIVCREVKPITSMDPTAQLIAARLNQKILEQKPTRFASLEKMLLLIQDIGGLSISSVVRRCTDNDGKEITGKDGARLFQLEIVYAHKPTSQYVSLDNAGSDFSGPWQLSAGIAFDAVSEWITRVDLAAFTTLNREQNYGQFGMSRLFGPNGFNLRLQAGYGEARPTGDLGVAGFRSEILNVSLQATQPLKRSRAENLTLRGGLELLHSDIGIAGLDGGRVRLSESHLRIARAAGQWSRLHGVGLTSIEVDGAMGLDFAGATPNNSTLSARPSSRSDFRKMSGRIVRRQGLDSDDFSSIDLTASLAGQYAFDVLPPSQKILLGGTDGVRGFYYGQLSGDHGVVATAELTYRLSARILKRESWRTFGAFYDYATVWDIAAFDPPRRQLQSVGALYREEIDVGTADQPAKLSVGLTAARRLTRDPTQTNAALLPQYRLIGSILVRL